MIGLALDESGWALVDVLLARLADHGEPLTRDELAFIVETSPKRRFAFSEDGTRIRASQGHSVDVDLALTPREPPPVLFHGTTAEAFESIRREGITRGTRQHVHLSVDRATAQIVARRRAGPHVIATVRAEEMHRAGHEFLVSENGVWLVAHVPPEFIDHAE